MGIAKVDGIINPAKVSSVNWSNIASVCGVERVGIIETHFYSTIHVMGGADYSGGFLVKDSNYKTTDYATVWITDTILLTAVYRTAGTNYNAKAYVMGGLNAAGSSIAETKSYNQTTWATETNIPSTNNEFSGASLGGYMYIIGGASWNNLVYYFGGSTWNSATVDPYNVRHTNQAETFLSKLTMLGGLSGGNPQMFTRTLASPNAAWDTSMATLPQNMGFSSVFLIGSRIYIANSNAAPNNAVYSHTGAGSWAAGTNYPVANPSYSCGTQTNTGLGMVMQGWLHAGVYTWDGVAGAWITKTAHPGYRMLALATGFA